MLLHSSVLNELCPICGVGNPLEIVYGVASEEMSEAAAAGQIALGSIDVGSEDGVLAFRCRETACATEWGVIDWEA